MTEDASAESEPLVEALVDDVPAEVAVEAPLEAPIAVVAETPKQWPEPAGDPGDGVRLGRLRDELGHLTDVGTLATVVGLAVEAAVRGGVRPAVIRAAVDAKVQG